jgi:hypothetical protein
MKNNKKAAMEMSVGTIVTIVLLMSVLVLGLVMVRNIFSGGTDLTSRINQKSLSEVDKIFEDTDSTLAFVPSDRQVSIKQGNNKDGFAFLVNNQNVRPTRFRYKIYIDPQFNLNVQCEGGVTHKEAESWLGGYISGNIPQVPPSSRMENPEMIRLNIPKTAPKCTIPYTVEVVNVEEEGRVYGSGKVLVSII